MHTIEAHLTKAVQLSQDDLLEERQKTTTRSPWNEINEYTFQVTCYTVTCNKGNHHIIYKINV